MSTPAVTTRVTRSDARKRIFWAALAAAGVAYELRALSDQTPGDTLSATFRWAFRTDTKQGQIVWTIVFGSFAAWFSRHIGNYSTPKPSN